MQAATQDLRTVNALIDETRANLQRGYALETRIDPTVALTFCSAPGNARFCTGTRFTEREEPVAIDLNAERAKLISLNEKKRELEAAAAAEVARCRASTGA